MAVFFFWEKHCIIGEQIPKKEDEIMRTKVLDLLRHAEGYISGERIASVLGISRTAVWKHIRELREAGYRIDSAPKNGYILRETPDLLLPAEIANGLGTELVGTSIAYYDTIGSTNQEAKRLAAEGAAEGTIVVAEEQAGGRGRLERPFFSPHGKGIWFSLILRPAFLPQEAPKCTLMAAVAVARAMKEFGLRAAIKWPNDILYEGKKLVGILTEMSAEMDKINYVVIGTGINVNIGEAEFPEPIRAVATSLSIMRGEPLSRVAFFQAVLRAMDSLYRAVARDDFAPVFDEWRRFSVTLGQEVRVISATGGEAEAFVGRAVDIDADGALLVDTEEGRRRVVAGDVSIRPKGKE